MDRKVDTRYLITDPEVCHGKLTFRGTRVFVADVLEAVARGRNWEGISYSWLGLPREAIAEAVLLAKQAFLEYADEYIVEYTVEKIPT